MRHYSKRGVVVGAATVVLILVVLWGMPAGGYGLFQHAALGPVGPSSGRIAGASPLAVHPQANGCLTWGPVINTGCGVETAGTYHYNGGSSAGTTVVLSVTPGYVGRQITVTGVGYVSGTPVGVFWNATLFPSFPMYLASCTTTGAGAIAAGCTFSVPSAPAGSHPVTTDDGGGHYATGAFTVASSLYLTPSTGQRSSAASASGYGFAASVATFAVNWTTPAASLCAGVTTGTFGAGTCAITVPSKAPLGSNTLTATDRTTSASNAPAFVVLPPSITLSVTSGVVGTAETVTGSGFTGTTPAAPQFAWVSLGPYGNGLCNGAISASGGFACAFPHMPNAAHGLHLLTAADPSGDSASAGFTVNASATISPTSGFTGDSATITGAGFAALATVTATWSPIPTVLCTVTSTNLGAVTCPITIPAGAQGVHAITVKDPGGNSSTVNFGLSPTVSVAFTNTFALYMSTPVALTWTITSSASITAAGTAMNLYVLDLGSTACAKPPCTVMNLSIPATDGQASYAFTLVDLNLSAQHSAYRPFPFNPHLTIGLFVTITSAGVSGSAGTSQNVFLQTYHPGAALVSPNPGFDISTGNVSIAVNYSGDFVTGASIAIFPTGSSQPVYSAGVASAGTGPLTGYAATPWRAVTPGTYSAVITISGPWGQLNTTTALRVIPAGTTVYINSTSYQNQSLIHGVNQATTGMLLLLIGLIIGLVVALLLGRMMWAGRGPGAPQPWAGGGAGPPKGKLMANECPTCHQVFGSETELAEHQRKAHGGS